MLAGFVRCWLSWEPVLGYYAPAFVISIQTYFKRDFLYHAAIVKNATKHLYGARDAHILAAHKNPADSHQISSYFVKRRAKVPDYWQTTTYTRYPKLGIVCDCRNHLIISTLLTRGPSPDINQLKRMLLPAIDKVQIDVLLVDAGYDSESNHIFAREVCGIKTIIPPKHGRPTKKLPPSRWRREMALSFDKETYGQRWQVETVFAMIKRNLGLSLSSRSYWVQCREMRLLCLTHNLMICRCVRQAFLQSSTKAFIQPSTDSKTIDETITEKIPRPHTQASTDCRKLSLPDEILNQAYL